MGLELAEKTIVKDAVEETDCVFLAGLYQAEKGLRNASCGSRPESLAGRRLTPQGARMARCQIALRARQQPETGGRAGVRPQGSRHHRRAGRRQNHDCEFYLAHPERAKGVQMLLCAPPSATGRRPKRSIGCLRSIRSREDFVRTRITRSTRTFSSPIVQMKATCRPAHLRSYSRSPGLASSSEAFG